MLSVLPFFVLIFNILQTIQFQHDPFLAQNHPHFSRILHFFVKLFLKYRYTLYTCPMENPLKIDRTKLMTQSAYAKLKGVTRGRINQMVKAGELKVVEIQGAKLIYVG